MNRDDFEKKLISEANKRLVRVREANGKSNGFGPKVFFSLSSFIQGGLHAFDMIQAAKRPSKHEEERE